MSSEPIDEERFVAGFILNKLYRQKRFARKRTGKHMGHIRLTSLHTGMPPGHMDVESVARKMNRQFVWIFPNEGEDQICAYIDKEIVEVGLPICNYYCEKVKIPKLDKLFREMLEEEEKKEEGKEDYRKLSEKEKRSREWYEKSKKWMEDQGLSNQSS